MNEAELTELVYTRISHDLIGNIGAVSNAVELLEEGDLDFLEDIKSILKTSSFTLSARLKFFRLAFGLGNTNVEQLDTLIRLAKDYLKTIGSVNYKIDLELGFSTLSFTKPALLLVMILSDALIKGGQIEILEQEGSLTALCASPNPLSEEKIKTINSILSDKEQEKTAQFAPVFYLKSVLKNVDLTVEPLRDGRFGFRIRKN